MDNFLSQEGNDAKNIFNRIRKRDFSGNTGQAIKNSSYQLGTNLITKFGSLLFTILIAGELITVRLLGFKQPLLTPELFGLYSLALATIVLFSAFSDFGIGTALLTFIAKMISKKDEEKAKAYFNKLLKWKIYLVLGVSLILLSSSYFVSKNYYGKPIFYALLAGGLYIPAVNLIGFIEQVFRADNNFKYPFIKELIYQFSRLTLVPIGIFFLLKTTISKELFVASILLLIVSCYLIASIFLMIALKKKIKFLKAKSSKLTSSETKGLKKFILPLSITVLSGVFFGYIDTLMLGHFVSESYIAYYGVAFGLVGSVIAIIGFTSISLFPLFSKMSGSSLENLFKKARNFTILISLASGIATYFLASFVIRIVYGAEYLSSIPLLKYFAIIVFLIPLSSLYDNFFISQKKTKVIAKLLIYSTVVNIILNYFFITYGLKFGMFEAVLGACFATIISRIFYLGGVLIIKRKINLSKPKL